MYRLSNSVMTFLNLLTLLASIPIIAIGLWTTKTNLSCQSLFQTPLLVIGFVILIFSLIGFVGACFHVAWLLWIYSIIMLILIVSLIVITIFGFMVTGPGGSVNGTAGKEYHLNKYSPWLRNKIAGNWATIRSCIMESNTCAKMMMMPYEYHYITNMSPIQWSCCKPPAWCNYGVETHDSYDCYQWNSAESFLCYDCSSCKAGVLETIRRDWRKVSLLDIVVILLLIGVYAIGCCALRNAKRAETDYPHGVNRMSKIKPRWDFHWWRWIEDRRHWLW